MPVAFTEEERRLTAAVSGELDHHGAKAVMEELDRRIDQALPRQLTLDLGGLTFTDSSGIAVLLRQQGEAQLLQGFEALSEALFWLEEAVGRSLRTLCIGVEPPD